MEDIGLVLGYIFCYRNGTFLPPPFHCSPLLSMKCISWEIEDLKELHKGSLHQDVGIKGNCQYSLHLTHAVEKEFCLQTVRSQF